MNSILIAILGMVLLVLSPFATMLISNGSYTDKAGVVIRYITYWIAVILAFLVGVYVGK